VRGQNADLFSSNTEWTDEQREQVTKWMKQTYDQFTKRVMTTRTGKIKDIDAVARGRIFSANEAINLGMVDKIGGIQDTIGYVAGKAGLQAGDYEVKVLPSPKTLADLLNGNGQGLGGDDSSSRFNFGSRMPMELQALLAAMGPGEKSALGMELSEMSLLAKRPVLLCSPVVVTVK
jgi:ClpP class serine protease